MRRIWIYAWSLLALGAGMAGAEEAPLAAPQQAPLATSQELPQRQHIPGTGITLEVPAGFSVSADFPGIGRGADLSSVMVTELDVSVSIAGDAFAAPALERRGMLVRSTAPIQVDGRTATLTHATQSIGSMTLLKWFLLFGDETHSVLLTATVPSGLELQLRDLLLGVLSSAHWNSAQRSAPRSDATIGEGSTESPPSPEAHKP